MAREWLTDKDSGNSTGAWKNFVKERQDLKKIIDEAKATDSELYTSLKNDPARYVEVMTHKYDGTKKPKDYPKEIIKMAKVERPKKPKPTIQQQLELEDYLNTVDPIWWKRTSQPSLEESNATYWENEFFDYKKNGGDLPFEQFKQMMINEADIEMTKQINKRVKDRLKDEGLAALLGVRA